MEGGKDGGRGGVRKTRKACKWLGIEGGEEQREEKRGREERKECRRQRKN